MSTATQKLPGFAAAKIAKVPSLACIGQVTEVGEGKLSSSEMYVVQPVQLTSTLGRRHGHLWMYRPNWITLSADGEPFQPSSFEQDYEEKAAKSMLFVYRKNIATEKGLSTLQGLAGSEAGFTTLSAAILTSPDKEIRTIQEILREFLLVTNEGGLVGYVLNQKTQKVESVDEETGETVVKYEPDQGYEIGSWFYTDPKSIQKIKRRAETSKDGMFKIAFDPDEF